MTDTTRQHDDVVVAIASAVTEAGGERIAIREGVRYRGDSIEARTFPGRFVRDGASQREIGDAKRALLASRPDRRYRQPKPPVPEGRRSSTAVAKRTFRAGDRVIQRGQALATDDPAARSCPSEFDFVVEGEPARRGGLLSPVRSLLGR